MGALLPIFLSASLGVAVWWVLRVWSRHQDARRAARDTLLADLSRHGVHLHWNEGASRYAGNVDGRPIEYAFVAVGSSEGGLTYETTARLRSSVATIEVEVRLAGFAWWFGGARLDDVRTGDEIFDSAYTVKCAHPQAAKALLDTRARRWLNTKHPARLHIREGSIVFVRGGRLDDADDMRHIILEMLRIDERLRSAAEPRGYRE